MCSIPILIVTTHPLPTPSLPLYLVGCSCLAFARFLVIYWGLPSLSQMPGSEVGVGLSVIRARPGAEPLGTVPYLVFTASCDGGTTIIPFYK